MENNQNTKNKRVGLNPNIAIIILILNDQNISENGDC